MYVSESTSAIEQWYADHRLPLPICKSSEELLHEMDLSKYPVERAFNGLSQEMRDTLKAVADIEPYEDYISPDLSGNKLNHYNDKGLDKLAKGLKTIAAIRSAFPKALRLADFFHLDPHTRGQR